MLLAELTSRWSHVAGGRHRATLGHTGQRQATVLSMGSRLHGDVRELWEQLALVLNERCADYPTVRPGDHLLVREPRGTIKRGDLVEFLLPDTVATASVKDSVLRVVGLAGETIEVRCGAVLINGHPLPEPYVRPGVQTWDFAQRTIPNGSV